MKRFIELLKSKTSLAVSAAIVGMAILNVIACVASNKDTAIGLTITMGVLATFPLVLALTNKK